MYCSLSAIILFSIINNVIYCDEIDVHPIPISIDNVINEYLVIEQKLWENIKSNYRNISTVLSIRKVHEPFLDKIRSHEIIWDKIVKVQSLDALTPFWHLHHLNNSIYLNELVKNVVNRPKDPPAGFYRNCAESVYNISMNDTFWSNIDRFVDNDTSRACINFESIESKYHLIYDAYVNIKAVLFKAYVNEQLRLMFLNCRTLYPNFHRNATQLRNEFRLKRLAYGKMVRKRLKTASRYVTGCDPSMSVGVPSHYIEITNFWQGHIVNEANLNEENTCKRKCTDYTEAKEVCNEITMKNPKEFKRTCVNSLRDCVELNDAKLQIAQPFMEKSWRRWFYKCSNCLCLCDEFNTSTESDRYFSLRDVVSNITENKVVTGLVILKLNGLIQFAVVEKRLLPFGEIEKTTKIKYVFHHKRDAVYDKSVFNHSDIKNFREHIDYFALNYTNRSVNLDTILVPRHKLVTGVRFQLHNGHLQLQVRATEFDFSTGKLINLLDGEWLSNGNGGKQEINTGNVRNPYNNLNACMEDDQISSDEHYSEDLSVDAFVRFQPSDPQTDFARATLPFIESYPLLPYNEVPLAGVGLYYKTLSTDGGFIAPKIAIYDFASHILAD